MSTNIVKGQYRNALSQYRAMRSQYGALYAIDIIRGYSRDDADIIAATYTSENLLPSRDQLSEINASLSCGCCECDFCGGRSADMSIGAMVIAVDKWDTIYRRNDGTWFRDSRTCRGGEGWC